MKNYRVIRDTKIKSCDLIPGEFYIIVGDPNDCVMQFVGWRSMTGNPTFVPAAADVKCDYYVRDDKGLIGFLKEITCYKIIFDDTLIQF